MEADCSLGGTTDRTTAHTVHFPVNNLIGRTKVVLAGEAESNSCFL